MADDGRSEADCEWDCAASGIAGGEVVELMRRGARLLVDEPHANPVAVAPHDTTGAIDALGLDNQPERVGHTMGAMDVELRPHHTEIQQNAVDFKVRWAVEHDQSGADDLRAWYGPAAADVVIIRHRPPVTPSAAVKTWNVNLATAQACAYQQDVSGSSRTWPVTLLTSGSAMFSYVSFEQQVSSAEPPITIASASATPSRPAMWP